MARRRAARHPRASSSFEALGSPSKVEFEVVQTFARGPIVFNERFDRFTLPQRSINWHGVGVFHVRDGKIAEWSDFTIREER